MNPLYRNLIRCSVGAACIGIYVPAACHLASARQEQPRQSAALLKALQSLNLSREQATSLRSIFREFRDSGAAAAQRPQLIEKIRAVLTEEQRNKLRDLLADAPAVNSVPYRPVPLICSGTDAETKRYRAAAAYSAGKAGLSLLVQKEGKVVFEEYQNGQQPNQPHYLASGTKSFWGVAAACAVSDGLLKLDEKASDTLEEWKSNPRKARITVRHLLNFTSGLKPVERLFVKPQVKNRYTFSVQSPALHEPGSVYRYDDVHLYCFGELLRRKLVGRAKPGETPEDVLAYLKRRVFKPIGLEAKYWARDAAGNPALPYGAVLPAREWAKFGQLLLQNGTWEGKQIVPPQPLQECFQGSKANPAYGLTFWLNSTSQVGARVADVIAKQGRGSRSDVAAVSAHGIYPEGGSNLVMAAGAGQQRLYIIPAHKMVVVRQANRGFPPRDSSLSDAEFLRLLLGSSPTR